jgi:hypothetical protein
MIRCVAVDARESPGPVEPPNVVGLNRVVDAVKRLNPEDPAVALLVYADDC